jgi:putative nucleotidyltransferase with HDIG domain
MQFLPYCRLCWERTLVGRNRRRGFFLTFMNQSATRRYVVACVIGAVFSTALVARFSPGLTWDNAAAAGFFALIGLAAQALAHRLPKGGSGSIGFIPFMSALVVAPSVSLVCAVGLAVLAAEVLQRRVILKASFNVAQHVLAISLATLVFAFLGGVPLPATGKLQFFPFAASFATFLVVNTVTVSGVMAVSENRKALQVWKQVTHGTVLYDFLALPVVYLFAWVYVDKGAWLASAIAFSLIGLRQLYKTNRQLETVNEEMLQLMVAAIEARDPYTSGHSQRVAEYSRIVASAAGLRSREIERVHTAALLHDVGKIHEEFAPILRKPGRLDEAEFAVMRTHSEKGAALVSKVTQFRDLVPAIRNHHEAWNGGGYPDQLAGDEIPLWARIIMFADTIDAMTTDRPYRQALSVASVRDELRSQAGRQFDPTIAAELIADRHWQQLADAIRSNHDSGRYELFSTVDVPRRTGTALPISA